MTPAIRASQIPVPARDGRCSRCGCWWQSVAEWPNERDEFCSEEGERCPCHDSRFTAAIYEASNASR